VVVGRKGITMKIYILCDMEGTSGIWRQEQVAPGSSHYQEGCHLLMGDINAAIAGAIDGGATELVVCDTHAMGWNVQVDQMDVRAEYETPVSACPMPSLDESFAGLILTGHHAMAGTIDGFLDHTMSPDHWFRFCINGREVGEIGMETAYAGHFGVPLIMVSGDEAACREAETLGAGIVTVPVKRGLGRNRARCLPPEKARAQIREGAAKAVRAASVLRPWKVETPITLDLTFARSDYADQAATAEGVERVDARTVRRSVARADWIWRI
jgi:D-amino peptidase